MVIYVCPICKKEFNKKSNYDNHTLNKKNPCDKSNFTVPPNPTNSPPSSTEPSENSTNFLNNLIDDLVKGPEPKNNNCVCMYCEKIFARTDSLQRHLNGRCKSKENYDELDKLKEDMKLIMQNYQKIESENVNLKKEIDEIKITQKGTVRNNKSNVVNNTINNNGNNQINKGVIVNNIQLVQFGNEDISKLNLVDAMKSYLKSTGGNIASTMLKYINLNEQYPENNNICMTDMSREIVKIHNGKKFVYKKFKNVKDDILNKIVKNTQKIVKNFEADKTFKKTNDINTKLKINEVSLKIIDGVSAEDIVREEIREKEREIKNIALLKNKILKIDENNNEGAETVEGVDLESNNDLELEEEEEEVERDFTFEERLRIEHLESKREGMQRMTFENIKDGLYNAKELIEKS